MKGTKLVPKVDNQNAKNQRGSKFLEDRKHEILINKIDKLIELFVNVVQNQEEGKNILVT